MARETCAADRVPRPDPGIAADQRHGHTWDPREEFGVGSIAAQHASPATPIQQWLQQAQAQFDPAHATGNHFVRLQYRSTAGQLGELILTFDKRGDC